MKVKDVMSAGVLVIRSNDVVINAARVMRDAGVDFLPVARDGRLVGALTDHDLVVRVLAERLDPKVMLVEDVMTAGAKYCYLDEDTGYVARNMLELRAQRLPVMDRGNRLVGIVTLGDLVPGAAALGQNGAGHIAA